MTHELPGRQAGSQIKEKRPERVRLDDARACATAVEVERVAPNTLVWSGKVERAARQPKAGRRQVDTTDARSGQIGPAGRPDMAPFRFIKWIDEGTPITLYGDGTQARDFTYIDDIARGTILAAQPLGYEVINLGGGNNPLTITAMITLMEQALGKEAKIDSQPASAADMSATWADISKAKRLLNWTPLISPVEGFQRTVKWYLQSRGALLSMEV